MDDVIIRSGAESDRTWIRVVLQEHWESSIVVSRGRVHDAASLPAFIAQQGAAQLGLLTYRLEERECEIVTLNSLSEGCGVGTALLNAIEVEARSLGCERLWLITTNDNLSALRFYQKRGYRLAMIYPGALSAHESLSPKFRSWDGTAFPCGMNSSWKGCSNLRQHDPKLPLRVQLFC